MGESEEREEERYVIWWIGQVKFQERKMFQSMDIEGEKMLRFVFLMKVSVFFFLISSASLLFIFLSSACCFCVLKKVDISKTWIG